MNKANEKAKRRSKAWRGVWISLGLLLVIPLLLCGGLATWFFGRQSSARAELTERLNDLEQRGEPIDDDGLKLLHKSNTSDEYQKRWVALSVTTQSSDFRQACKDVPILFGTEEDDPKLRLPPPSEPWPNRSISDAFLKSWNTTADEIIDLGIAELDPSRKTIRRPIEFNSLSTLLPDSQNAREFSRILLLRHAVATYDGDSEDALRCIEANIGLERSLDGEPIIISQLIGLAIASMTNSMIQKSVEFDQLSDEQLDRIKEKLDTFAGYRNRYQLAIRGERAMMLPLFSNPEKAGEALGGEADGGTGILSRGRSIDALYYLDQMDSYLEISESDPAEFQKDASQTMANLQSDVAGSSAITKFDRAFSYLLIPAIESYAKTVVRQTESNRLAKLAMEIRKFQHKNNRWPKSLNELAENGIDLLPLRPVHDPAFGYKVDQNGDAIVWGVDSNKANQIPDNPPEAVGIESNRIYVWQLRNMTPKQQSVPK